MRRLLRKALGRRERVVPVVLPATGRAWRRAAPDDWAARLHLRYLHTRDRVHPAYFARAGSYPMPRGLRRTVRWFLADVLVQALRLARRNGPAVRAAAGVPLRRQLWQLLWLSTRVPAMPEKYYTFEWYRPDNRARAGDYLHRHETKGGLYELLAEVVPAGGHEAVPAGGQVAAVVPAGRRLAEAAPLNDKVAFAAHARRGGLPVVPTLAVIDHGEVHPTAQTGDLPAADLFVKPLAGKGGRGAQKWCYAAATDSFRSGRCDQTAPEVTRADLLGFLATGHRDSALVVQPCLTNHPDVAELALDALATCRIITMINEAGAPEPVIAIFRMAAVRAAVVDNMHRGGLAAPVDLVTGELGPASGYAVAGPAVRHRTHPVSGATIAGRTLPGWDAVRQLAVDAHRQFLPRLLIGWDIALGPDGPVLVEGNEQPGVDGLQRLHDTPLGRHRFGQLLAYHLDRPSPTRGTKLSGSTPASSPPAIIRRWRRAPR